jgi:hypothetical protein
MGRDYYGEMRRSGIADPGAYFEAQRLEKLKVAWSEASEVSRAEFMVWSGLRPDPEEATKATPVTNHGEVSGLS